MDVWVVMGSHEACCGDWRRERVVCARGKGWYGSVGSHELAHSGRSDHAIDRLRSNLSPREAILGLYGPDRSG